MPTTIPLRSGRGLPIFLAVAAAATVAVPSAGHAQDRQAGPADLPPELASARALLDKYRDPIVAVHDGYLSTLACLEFPTAWSEGEMRYSAGGMGVHFLNPGNIGPALDPAKPQVLIYVPEGDRLRLVAAEWFLPAAAAGAEPPTIFGKALAGPMEGHKPIMPEGLHHYDLHVWLWQPNPAGMFSPTNPTVDCPEAGYTFAGGPPRMVPHGRH